MTFIRVFLFILASAGLSAPSLAGSHQITNFFRKIDHQLCGTFKSLKCRNHQHHKSVVAKAKPTPPTKMALPALALMPVPQPAISVVKPIPRPTLKPDRPAQIAVPVSVPIVVPHLKPETLPSVAPVVPVLIPTPQPAPVTTPPQRDIECLDALKAKGVDFAMVPQPAGLPSCVVVEPVQLISIRTDGLVVQLPDHPILNCAFALHFASWLQELGGPAATAKEGFALTSFFTGPGYQCRGRNGDSSAKISEHGSGNAVDIERLKFSDGRMFLVHDAIDPQSPAFETLKAIRASACTRFTTVLGPGANAAHSEHFHFDLGVHGKSGTYRICE